MCVIQRNNDDDKVFALLSARILRIADRLDVPLANGKAVLMVQQSRPVALVIFRRESIEFSAETLRGDRKLEEDVDEVVHLTSRLFREFGANASCEYNLREGNVTRIDKTERKKSPKKRKKK